MYNFTKGFTAKEASMLTLTSDTFVNFRERVYAGIRYNATKDYHMHVESFKNDPTIGTCVEMRLFKQELENNGFAVYLDEDVCSLSVAWKSPVCYIV